MRIREPNFENHACCYANCQNPPRFTSARTAATAIGFAFDLDRWNQNRARFVRDGGGCEMQELGELLCYECSFVRGL